jgi:hypothetical protein
MSYQDEEQVERLAGGAHVGRRSAVLGKLAIEFIVLAGAAEREEVSR